MVRLLIAIFATISGTTGIYAQADTVAAPRDNPIGKSIIHQDVIPDAMRHLVKGPDVDIASLRDPFASYLALVAARSREALAKRQSHLASRKHEVLEAFDLAALTLVATMRMGENRVAMVEDSAGKGYIVRRGDYMGKHNGRIKKITDNSLYLVEQIVNPAGDIVKRKVTLTLKEVSG